LILLTETFVIRTALILLNAINQVFEYVKSFIQKNRFDKSDLLRIVHLIDTDGAFIPVVNVIGNANIETEYFNDRIETSHLAATLSRMKNTTEIVCRLSTTPRIGGISYSVFFFSRNLEHVLHDISRELSRQEKNGLSDVFEDQYGDRPNEFADLLKSQNFAVPGTYIETWNIIKQGTNSLIRKSNFNLFFDE